SASGGTSQLLALRVTLRPDGQGVPVGARLLRVPDGKARFLTSKRNERGVRREEDQVFSLGHAQQQAVERIAVRLRSFDAGQDMFAGYRQNRGSCRPHLFTKARWCNRQLTQAVLEIHLPNTGDRYSTRRVDH